MISCVFAAAALEPLAILLESLPGVGRLVVWPKAAPSGILIAIVVSALPYTLKPMHAHREGHKHVGLWLANNMDENDWLKDPLAWGEWYAGRTLYHPPVYHGRPTSVWVIVEKGKGSPHSRLPQWEEAVMLPQVNDRSIDGRKTRRTKGPRSKCTSSRSRTIPRRSRSQGRASERVATTPHLSERSASRGWSPRGGAPFAPGAGRILDLGCGVNSDLEKYHSPEREVWGTDFQAHPELRHRGRFRLLGNDGRIPFPDNHFEQSPRSWCWSMSRTRTRFPAKLHGCFEPGGRFIGHTISGRHYVTFIRRFIGLLPHSVSQSLVKKLYGRDEVDTFPAYYRLNSETACGGSC